MKNVFKMILVLAVPFSTQLAFGSQICGYLYNAGLDPSNQPVYMIQETNTNPMLRNEWQVEPKNDNAKTSLAYLTSNMVHAHAIQFYVCAKGEVFQNDPDKGSVFWADSLTRVPNVSWR